MLDFESLSWGVVANPGTPPNEAYLKMVDFNELQKIKSTTGVDRASMVTNVPENVDLSSVLSQPKGISNQV
ncbi:hypothetical protein EYZ11_009631 [Aspergillus tanneri]|uniref:Uncharacterized protein n=1 Tax=Aspergillus tanneri TaxID=1220188 RepID=A0A4V3UNF2_9EURO|nr:uncharacterized protein ATNIH1004_009373 [Aspergillus tanneri]KAA8645156.1 hypothetical protein ATNIH1004_009373 [Aspergillus tanneri]THC90914.1 hypothetical protein EYZ11_009631 [Aspergillus tanneri]